MGFQLLVEDSVDVTSAIIIIVIIIIIIIHMVGFYRAMH